MRSERLTAAATPCESSEPSAPVNAALPWDQFDTLAYLDHNYRYLRDDDQLILRNVATHFAATMVQPGRRTGRTMHAKPTRAIDVGTGANLYPALAMLPFCTSITMLEWSAPNVAWLREEVAAYSSIWDPYWSQLSGRPAYRGIGDPRTALAARTAVVAGDIFAPRDERWDLGTMFFVAESLTGDPAEFEQAVRSFLHCLSPGAPFAAAFMENSRGYAIGDLWFPAVPVGRDTIHRLLARLVHTVVVQPIPTMHPLRDGYDGMILALGTV